MRDDTRATVVGAAEVVVLEVVVVGVAGVTPPSTASAINPAVNTPTIRATLHRTINHLAPRTGPNITPSTTHPQPPATRATPDQEQGYATPNPASTTATVAAPSHATPATDCTARTAGSASRQSSNHPTGTAKYDRRAPLDAANTTGTPGVFRTGCAALCYGPRPEWVPARHPEPAPLSPAAGQASLPLSQLALPAMIATRLLRSGRHWTLTLRGQSARFLNNWAATQSFTTV